MILSIVRARSLNDEKPMKIKRKNTVTARPHAQSGQLAGISGRAPVHLDAIRTVRGCRFGGGDDTGRQCRRPKLHTDEIATENGCRQAEVDEFGVVNIAPGSLDPDRRDPCDECVDSEDREKKNKVDDPRTDTTQQEGTY